MKTFSTLFIAGAGLLATSQAFVINMYGSKDCTGDPTSRNVYDNTCAYVGGFSSYEVTAYGGDYQQLSAISEQSCSGDIITQVCVSGVDAVPLNSCQGAFNKNGASNALTSYSNAGACPK